MSDSMYGNQQRAMMGMQTEDTAHSLIKRLEERAERVRGLLKDVPAWQRELEDIEAMLGAILVRGAK